MTAKIRTRNLRILHGLSTDFGAPTSKSLYNYLARSNVNIKKEEISDIYQGCEIDNSLAYEIEKSFDLPSGWLSRNNDIVFKTSNEDTEIFNKFLLLNQEHKDAIRSIINAIHGNKNEFTE